MILFLSLALFGTIFMLMSYSWHANRWKKCKQQTKGSLTERLLQGPIGIAIGTVYGFVFGLVVGKVLPSEKSVRSETTIHHKHQLKSYRNISIIPILILNLFFVSIRFSSSSEICKRHSIHNDGFWWYAVSDWKSVYRFYIGRCYRMHRYGGCVHSNMAKTKAHKTRNFNFCFLILFSGWFSVNWMVSSIAHESYFSKKQQSNFSFYLENVWCCYALG